jgi:exopolysaccharide biosynthesis polyprenyl glycosylphosphotransferase
MNSLSNREPSVLLLGDILSLLAALWLSLFLRTFIAPSNELFFTHLVPFSLLFLVWVVVFYIAGLYERHTLMLQSRLPSILFNAQIVNSTIAVVFFYFVPFFGITPKTILFIYLVVSFILIFFWRAYVFLAIGVKQPIKAVLVGSGEEMKELFEEVNSNPLYNFRFVSSVDLDRTEGSGFKDEVVGQVYSEGVSLIAIDLSNERVEPVLPSLYNLIFSKIQFVDMYRVYEDIFKRVPLSLLKYNWFLENISTSPRHTYDALKRVMDILISIPLLIIPFITYPFAFIMMKIEDGGPIFIHQERLGKNNQVVRIVKFRTMTANDHGNYENGETKLKVTKVGAFLRKSRLDEFPQLWNVLKGDISLIGPRPELPALVKLYEKEIPYYNVRHLIKPGLSGWAQIYQDTEHPHHAQAVMQTKEKLSYDLFYIKNRSFILDLKIALKTIKTLLSRVGV